MRQTYNSHIVKFEAVTGSQDHRRLHRLIQECHGTAVILRVSQGGAQAEFEGLVPNIWEALQARNMNPTLPFDAELITRSPEPRIGKALPPPNSACLDHADTSHLHHNGSANMPMASRMEPLRGSPMFFRENGASLDMINLFSGQPLFLVLNGHSFAETDRKLLARPGIMTFGVNNGAHGFRPNFWTCVDDPTRFLRSIWADPKIMKFVPLGHFQKPIWDRFADRLSDEKVADFPNVIGYRRNEAFSAEHWLHQNTINWGRHSSLGGGRSVMLVALRIAYLLGFRKVYLTGCDFYMDAQKKYWFEEERANNAIKNNQNSYRILSGYFEELLPHFTEAGLQVFNCTPRSRLKVFPTMTLEEAVNASEISVTESTNGMYVDRYKSATDGKATPRRERPPETQLTTPAP